MADTTWYVDPDASGANDGSSWTDAYENLVGATSLQTALDAANDADNTTIYVRLSSSSTFDMGGGTGLTVTNGGSPSGAVVQVNKWVKVIACDAAGDPITVADRGTYLTILATASVTTMLNYSGDPHRVAWYGFKFDGNDATATNVFKQMNSETSGNIFFHVFVNCCFEGGNSESCYFQSEFRGAKFIDCDFTDDHDVSNSNPEAQYNATYIRCRFDSDYQYPVRTVGTLGSLYYHCTFDANNNSYCIRNNSSYAQQFINCAFVNFTIAAIVSDAQANFDNIINCYFEGNDPVNDKCIAQLYSDDSLSTIAMYCASNLDNGLFDGTNFVLAPYIAAADVLFDNEAANVRVSGSYQLASTRKYEGLPDLYGNRSLIGPENMNATTEMKRRRHHV